MDLLHHGVDRSVIALWLGRESIGTTAIYPQADMTLKEQALAKTDAADVHTRAATAPTTNSWPSSGAFDYAECQIACAVQKYRLPSPSGHPLGITRHSGLCLRS